VHFARQPIVSAEGDLAGYELIAMERPAHAGALAALTGVDLQSAGGGADVFLDVTPSALTTLHPLPFEPDGIVLEIPADSVADDLLLERLASLHEQGYRIAVDGIRAGVPGTDLLPFADFAKVPVTDRDGLDRATAAARLRGATLVATDVASLEERDELAASGFTLFQGEFYCRPRVLPAPPAVAGLSRLRSATRIAACGDSETLTSTISQDPALSLRLLRFINSAAIALRHEVSSVPHAIRLLGPRTVRQWALLVLVSGEDRRVSVPLLLTALARARTCETIALRQGMPGPDAYFLVGLLSVADALLDATMEAILADVPVTDDVRAALLEHAGGKGRALSMAIACENGDFAAAALPGLDAGALLALHAAALAWADATASGIVQPVAA
jgi:EAL and modified HD-GYP domain-containing signal transduction protein